MEEMMDLIGSFVGNPWWGVFASAMLVLAFAMTAWVIFHEPRSRKPGPGHPAYEGDEDEDE